MPKLEVCFNHQCPIISGYIDEHGAIICATDTCFSGIIVNDEHNIACAYTLQGSPRAACAMIDGIVELLDKNDSVHRKTRLAQSLCEAMSAAKTGNGYCAMIFMSMTDNHIKLTTVASENGTLTANEQLSVVHHGSCSYGAGAEGFTAVKSYTNAAIGTKQLSDNKGIVAIRMNDKGLIV